MKEHFNYTILTNAIPHYAFCCGLAVGGAFAQYCGGRFLTGTAQAAIVWVACVQSCRGRFQASAARAAIVGVACVQCCRGRFLASATQAAPN